MRADVVQRRARALCAWFTEAARDLPWRRERNGYTALVAEAMLQQTQVARVVPKYIAFLERFPTVKALAAANEDDVLAEWQGLGYYRRARSLHAAAQMIVRDHAGVTPLDVDALLELKGVGRYTAGSIASIVGGFRTPIVDGNVRRVLARWEADTPEASAAPEPWCWDRAEAYVNAAEEPAVFNEALMEFGATVCTPRNPGCAGCPLRADCAAAGLDDPASIPAAKAAPVRKDVHHHCVVVTRGSALLLEKRPATGLWSNLWQAPTVEAAVPLGDAAVAAGLTVMLTAAPERVGDFVFQTTHRRVRFHVFRGKTRMRKGTWAPRVDLGRYALSNAQKRVLATCGIS